MAMSEYELSLVMEAKRNKQKAFDRLYDALHKTLCAVIDQQLGDRSRAESILREVFERMKVHIRSINNPADFETIAIRETVAECRKYPRSEKPVAFDGATQFKVYINENYAARNRQAAGNMPPASQAAAVTVQPAAPYAAPRAQQPPQPIQPQRPAQQVNRYPAPQQPQRQAQQPPQPPAPQPVQGYSQPAAAGLRIRMVNAKTSQQVSVSVNPELVIGRKAASGVYVIPNDTGISRKHCRLFVNNNKLWVEDLGSTNHTFVNGKCIQQPTPISSGDEMRVANTRLVIYY
ncbi:MAG: FHA domain-containing protein [Clostridia bacterium]|nr:FHA domain-containing protein [Clostridia bacterium]